MGAIAGKDGNVTFASGYTTGVYTWTIDYTADALDSTAYASLGFYDYIPGLKGWSGTYGCRLDNVAIVDHPGMEAAAAVFSATTGITYTGAIIITGIAIATPVDGICEVTFTYQGSGHIGITGQVTTTTSSSSSTTSTSSSSSSSSSTSSSPP